EDNEIENRIVQFYTDLNTDGRFLNVGENIWGLRDWYSVADIEEKIAPTIQKFDILEEEDEEDKTLKLLGEDDADEDDDIPTATDDKETLENPDVPNEEQIDEEITDNEIMIDEEEEKNEDIEEEDDYK